MKKKLAIVSTFDDLCGIASYTRSIIRQLENDYEITVFDLDQFIFKTKSQSVSRLANQEINRICKLLPNFDAVNIQLEHGTLGNTPKQILRRLLKLCEAAPKLCITFHTILHSEKNTKTIYASLFRGRMIKAWKVWRSDIQNNILSEDFYRALRELQKVKPVSVICHTRRDARYMKLVYGIDNCYDHPLAFYKKSETIELQSDISYQEDFPILYKNLNQDDVLLGCFGFLGTYKGLDTAIKALKLLPKNYKLAVFGGLHPNAINKNELINPYLDSIVGQIHAGENALSTLSDLGGSAQLAINSPEQLNELLTAHSDRDISDRVLFMGSLTDEQFPKAMSICDIVLMPYVEVGQSASGPMSMAVDVGSTIIASRTKAFMQFARYNPDRFEMFDVGNYVHLSQLIMATDVSNKNFPDSSYTVESNIEVYKKALFWR